VTGAALLYPEYILTALGLTILVADLVTPRASKRNLAWLTVMGLLLALAASALVAVSPPLRRELPGWAASQLTVDQFAMFFKLTVLIATMLVVLASPDYVERRIGHSTSEFYALIVFAALGMILMASSTDLISLYLAMEFTSLTSYVLAGYQKSNQKSAEAGLKYFLLGVVSSGLMLYGLSFVFGATGTTSLKQIALHLQVGDATKNPLLMPAVVMVLAGFGFKMALVPFHQWCPDVYEGAPTPFAALLSVGPKAAGFAMLMRVLFTALGALEAQWSVVLALIAALTMTVGNLGALHQTNLKRMLAYSSIAQAGYMLIGIAATGADPNWRTSGVLLYLFSYAFMNVGAFVCAMVLLEGSETEDIEQTRNFVRRSPLTTLCLLVFLASLAGIPATSGFVAKALVFGAAIDAKMTWLGAIGWINTVISMFYYFNVVRFMFNFPPNLTAEHGHLGEDESTTTTIALPLSLQVALATCAVWTVLIGLYPGPFIELARSAGEAIVGG